MNMLSNLIIKSPKITLLLIFVATLILGSGLGKLVTKNNNDSELPDNDPIVLTSDRLEEIFGGKDIILIGMESENIYSHESLTKIVNITEDLKKIPGLLGEDINSLSTVQNIKGEEWGLEVDEYMEEVPTTQEELDLLKKSISENNLIYGRMVSKDGKFTAITANIKDGYEQGEVDAMVHDIVKKYEGPETFYLAGDPIQGQAIDVGIQEDMGVLLPTALLLVLIGYFITFRSIRGVVLPILVVILSVVWTMGLMGHLGLPITVVSSALPMLMVAVASSYGIHVLFRYYEEVLDKKQEEGVYFGLKNIMPAILITGITTSLGAATLIIFKVASIKEFGIITALGIICIVTITLTLIPAALMLMKKQTLLDKQGKSKGIWMENFLIAITRFSIRNRILVLVSTAIILVISSYGITKIQVGSNFIELFPTENPLRIAFNKFNDNLGGTRYMDIMIDAGEPDAIKNPVILNKMLELQAYAEQLEGVGYASSFAEIITRLNKEMNGGDKAFENIPQSQELVAQYLLLYSMSSDPDAFSELVDYDYQRARIRLMLTTSEQLEHLDLYDKLSTLGNEKFGEMASIEFGGEVMFWLAQIRYIVTGKIQNIFLALTLVLIFCIFVFRSFIGGLLSTVPLIVSSVTTFGVMGFLDIRLDTSTAIITAMGIGIGIDFAIHYLSRIQEEMLEKGEIEKSSIATSITSGKAIIYDALSNILGFSVFVFSGFLPLQYFGWLISFTMITVAFGTLMLFPALFSLLKPSFLKKRSILVSK